MKRLSFAAALFCFILGLTGCTTASSGPSAAQLASEDAFVNGSAAPSYTDELKKPCDDLHVFVTEALAGKSDMASLNKELVDITKAAVDGTGTAIADDLSKMTDVLSQVLLGGAPTNSSDLALSERDAETQCYLVGDWVVVPNGG